MIKKVMNEVESCLCDINADCITPEQLALNDAYKMERDGKLDSGISDKVQTLILSEDPESVNLGMNIIRIKNGK